jgi:hypothetical protein
MHCVMHNWQQHNQQACDRLKAMVMLLTCLLCSCFFCSCFFLQLPQASAVQVLRAANPRLMQPPHLQQQALAQQHAQPATSSSSSSTVWGIQLDSVVPAAAPQLPAHQTAVRPQQLSTISWVS